MTTIIQESGIQHPDYIAFSSRWRMVRDVLAGKHDIDLAGTRYLPCPVGYDTNRYEAYQTRAVLYNATSRTADGYMGAIFRKPADIQVPEQLEYLLEDTDGKGNSLIQFSKIVSKDVVSLGRQGVLIDYPDASNVKTLKDEREMFMKARFSSYTAESIVNWETKRVGSKTVLVKLMLREDECTTSGHAFNQEVTESYRLLELDEKGEYTVKKMTPTEESDGTSTKKFLKETGIYKPTLKDGSPLKHIPFMFIGSETFLPCPDLPPLYDLAQLNVAHYRNSADFEQACFMVGQPTPWISGLDNTFIEENRGSLVIGSNTAWLLPDGAAAGMLESKVNKGMILQAMELKEAEMIGIGARIIQDNTSKGSEATESVQLRRSGEASQLSTIADNISIAMVQLFKWAAMWEGVPESEIDDIKYLLNKDFFSAMLSAQHITSLVASWQGGAISHEVLLNNLRRGEIVSELKTNEDVKDEIESEPPPLGTVDSFSEPMGEGDE